jgi:hypothetical protein
VGFMQITQAQLYVEYFIGRQLFDNVVASRRDIPRTTGTSTVWNPNPLKTPDYAAFIINKKSADPL